MSNPRFSDRRTSRRDTTRINEGIRVSEVRLVNESGEQIGVVSLSEALEQAQTQGLDLVEIVPQAKPPVCRLLDYPKYKYEQARKEKLAHKKQRAAMTTTHEVKLSMRIAEHDYETKKKHILRFLNGGDRVKVTVMLRGREQAHADMGVDLLTRVASDTAELSVVNQKPSHEGRNIHMLLSPLPAAQRSENHKPVAEPVD